MKSSSVQGAFTSGELSPALMARVDFNKYAQGCLLLSNCLVQPHGPAVKRPGFLLLDEIPEAAVLVRFVFNQNQAYALAFGDYWMRVFTTDGPVLDENGDIYQVNTPYSLAQAKTLSTSQSADVLFIACEGVAPQRLKRLDHDNWEFEAISFTAPMAAPTGLSASRSGGEANTPYTYYVTAMDAEGRESELSNGADITGPASNNWASGASISLNWAAVSGAVEYRVYKASFSGRPGYVDIVGSTTYTDYNITPSLSEGAPKYEDPFPNGDYPRVISFFEQRLVFASTPNRPQTIWMSKSGDYTNFAQYTPLTADSPWEGTIVSPEMSRLVWMVPLRSLVVGATMMEWEVAASQGAFSAETAKSTPQSYIGSDIIQAIVIGNTILHVARSGAKVRALGYDFGTDSYDGPDRSILATHLLETERILNWTYQQHPNSVVWMTRSDGTLLGLTFHEEHDVIAWHRHETDGAFLSVCSVPNGHDDALFAVTQREVQGSSRYFVEKMGDPYYGGDYSLKAFMDCALIYDQSGEEISTLSGLEHLEGKEVWILSKGAVEAPRVVKRGSITLDKPSDRVIVGLPVVADIETMPIEVVGNFGSSVGRKKLINEVSLRVQNTVGLKTGLRPELSGQIRYETVKWRSDEPMGSPPRPFSGDKGAVFPSLSCNVATVNIRSDEPTPMSILSIITYLDMQ